MSTVQHLPSAVEVLLADGTTALIRPLAPADHDAVLDLHTERMSDASRRMRFFGASRRAPELAVDRLCGPPRPGFLALSAWVGGDLVGEADYESESGHEDAAELAVAVADAWQHRGVGTLLIEHLVHAARERGIHTIEADTLASNRAVHQVFSDLGLPVHRHFDQGEIKVAVPLDESDEHYREAVDERGRAADVASLAALLRPRSVAVVGASRRPGSVGQAVLRKIREGGFTGEVWAVNPHAEQIAGEPAYPALSALPRVPDLAVLAVPPAVVASAAEECGRAGVRALVVLTSGLGADAARQLMHACRGHSMRLVGPNSLGIAQTDPEVRLDAEFGGAFPLPGTAGVAVQSGGVGIALLERLAWLGIGVSSFVSLGDKYDVSGNDLLQWWEGDGQTDLALLHVESFGSPRAFARTARRVTRTIPVLTVDAGRSAAGRRGAASHTAAAAATPTVTREALFRQAGITATRAIAGPGVRPGGRIRPRRHRHRRHGRPLRPTGAADRTRPFDDDHGPAQCPAAAGPPRPAGGRPGGGRAGARRTVPHGRRPPATRRGRPQPADRPARRPRLRGRENPPGAQADLRPVPAAPAPPGRGPAQGGAMNHSILDGTPADGLADAGQGRALGHAAVRDWMSRPAIAVTPATDFGAMVAAITASRRGVLPVVSPDGKPLGVVAASDLLAAYDSSDGPLEITAQDLMTAPAITVSEDVTVAEAVRTARAESVHHLPVVDGDGRLSGLLSPIDLLEAFRADDDALRTVALAQALTPGSGVMPSSLHVRCERGHVVLAGRTRSRSDAAALCLRVAAIEGLTGVIDRLRWDVDDTDPGGASGKREPR